MVRLKHANDEKSTTGGREFHTFITLSANTCSFCSLWFIQLIVLHTRDPLFLRACQMRQIVKTDINHAKNYFVTKNRVQM